MINEQQIIYFVQEIKSPLIDRIAFFISESYLIVIPLTALYLFYKRKNFYHFVFSVVITLTIAITLKNLISAARPCAELQVHFLECKNPMSSFPSAHTALAFTPTLFFLSEIHLFIAYLIYASLIAITRIYLGMHYPHDVFAGALIGILVSYICLNLKKKKN